MRIKVLWIDDEYKKQLDVIGHAEQDGIDIIPFESHEEGIAALMSDIKGFHAVILDAKVKKAKDDTVTNLKGLAASRDRLIELNNQGVFMPYFIFTGQPDYMNDENFRDSYGDYFTKGNDNQKLFDTIKEVVLNKEEYIIHKNYGRVFQVIEKDYDVETRNTLTEVLKVIMRPKEVFEDELYFTQLRIILEKLFRLANRAGLLHDKCLMGGKVNLTESSLFLAGEPTKHLDIFCSKKHFSKITAEIVKNMLFITGAASHTIDPDFKNNIDIHNYRKTVNSPYLLQSLTLQLMDVIIWFDEYKKEHSDYYTNVSYWQDITNLIEGIVTRIADNGYGTFLPNNDTRTLSIIPKLITEHNLVEGQAVKVRTKIEGAKTLITEIV